MYQIKTEDRTIKEMAISDTLLPGYIEITEVEYNNILDNLGFVSYGEGEVVIDASKKNSFLAQSNKDELKARMRSLLLEKDLLTFLSESTTDVDNELTNLKNEYLEL